MLQENNPYTPSGVCNLSVDSILRFQASRSQELFREN